MRLKDDKKSNDETLDILRDDLFRLISDDFRDKGHLLPVRTVEVPAEFFDATGMTVEEFAETRYPGWTIEHVEKNISTMHTTIIFQKDADYVNRIVELEGHTVAREISESTPEIDWDTLLLERPDLHELLGKERVVIELDEDALEDLMEHNPEELAALQRHMKVKKPTQRLTARKVKSND